MSKKETPVAVRVARWTAAAAAITALGTIGNTFIEKRPWFLGGEDEKPAVVSTIKTPAPVVEHHESPVIHFNATSGTGYVMKKKAITDDVVVASTASSDHGAVAMSVTTAAAPDLGWYNNVLTYMYYRPFTFWTIAASVLILGGYLIIELLHSRQTKKS